MKCYLIIKNINGLGQVAELRPVGNAWGMINSFFSKIYKADTYAKKYAKKNGIEIV